MNQREAQEVMNGFRSFANHFRSMTGERAEEQREVWLARADAALAENAYWVLRAHKEDLVEHIVPSMEELIGEEEVE